jgi:hypothetical protein
MQRKPLYPVNKDGTCGCGIQQCPNAGKHPAPRVIEGGGFALITGNGIITLDIDCKPGKPNGFESLKARPDLDTPDTYTVGTPTGGQHLHYSYDVSKYPTLRNRSGFIPGCDIRGSGGLAVLPGSPHKNGGTYTHLRGEYFTPAPQWLIDAANLPNEKVEKPEAIPKDHPEFDWRCEQYRQYLETCPPAEVGNSGGSRVLVAMEVGVRRWLLPRDVVLQLAWTVYNPRCIPPCEDIKLWEYKVDQAIERGRMPVEVVAGDKSLTDAIVALTAPPKKSVVRRQPSPDHQYTFVVGSVCMGTGKTSLSNLTNTFLTHPDWEGVWQYDEFTDRICAVDPPMQLDAETKGFSEIDCTKVINWLESVQGLTTSTDMVRRAIESAANSNKYHPVKEYLESLPTPTTRWLDGLAKKVLGNDLPVSQDAVKKFLVAAVRRIYDPGCQVDNMLTLYSAKQGEGKTTFCKVLFGKHYLTMQADLAGKDASDALVGYWGVEMEELDKILRVEATTAKAFLSRHKDVYRPAYGRYKVSVPRQCVFMGTSNVQDFLRDATGDRRYWPVEVGGKVNIKWLEKHRDEIWSEAYALSKTDYLHHFEDESVWTEVRENFQEQDEWYDIVRDYCTGRSHVKSSDILTSRFGLELGRVGRREKNRVCDIFRRLGCEPRNVKVQGKQMKVWIVPILLSSELPSHGELSKRTADYQNLPKSN